MFSLERLHPTSLVLVQKNFLGPITIVGLKEILGLQTTLGPKQLWVR